MTTMIVLSVVDVVLLIAGLAFYLYVVGGQLTRIATNLEECADLVAQICRNADSIRPDLEHVNRSANIVAGALPLLYGMAEGIVVGVTPRPETPEERPPARPASGRRRSRMNEGAGYVPPREPVTAGES
jgi:hypothetical protein